MATYFFETITDAQAAAYTAADNLVFGQTGETARLTTVIFNAATATTPPKARTATTSSMAAPASTS